MIPFPRRASLLLATLVVLGCGGEPAGDEGGAAAAPEGAAAASADPGETLAKFAGRWQVNARNEVGDSLPSHVLTATADTTGWTITFPDRAPIPVRIIEASGDLVVIETEPYESVLRPGVRVTVQFVERVSGDRTSGRLLALYDVAGSNAILRGVTEGTRQP
jgi:hypothetical protein